MAMSPDNQSEKGAAALKIWTISSPIYTGASDQDTITTIRVTTKHFQAPDLRIKKNQATTMINPKKLAQLARKWQRVKIATKEDDRCCTISPVANKGHCTMYTADGSRFEDPLAYLSSMVFSELLRMAEEEFGFTGNGRITLPCDAAVVEYMICLLRRNASEEVEKAFLSSVVMPCQQSSYPMPPAVLHQQFAVCSS